MRLPVENRGHTDFLKQTLNGLPFSHMIFEALTVVSSRQGRKENLGFSCFNDVDLVSFPRCDFLPPSVPPIDTALPFSTFFFFFIMTFLPMSHAP